MLRHLTFLKKYIRKIIQPQVTCWIKAWTLIGIKQSVVSLSLNNLSGLVKISSVINTMPFLNDCHGWKVQNDIYHKAYCHDILWVLKIFEIEIHGAVEKYNPTYDFKGQENMLMNKVGAGKVPVDIFSSEWGSAIPWFDRMPKDVVVVMLESEQIDSSASFIVNIRMKTFAHFLVWSKAAQNMKHW